MHCYFRPLPDVTIHFPDFSAPNGATIVLKLEASSARPVYRECIIHALDEQHFRITPFTVYTPERFAMECAANDVEYHLYGEEDMERNLERLCGKKAGV